MVKLIDRNSVLNHKGHLLRAAKQCNTFDKVCFVQQVLIVCDARLVSTVLSNRVRSPTAAENEQLESQFGMYTQKEKVHIGATISLCEGLLEDINTM